MQPEECHGVETKTSTIHVSGNTSLRHWKCEFHYADVILAMQTSLQHTEWLQSLCEQIPVQETDKADYNPKEDFHHKNNDNWVLKRHHGSFWLFINLSIIFILVSFDSIKNLKKVPVTVVAIIQSHFYQSNVEGRRQRLFVTMGLRSRLGHMGLSRLTQHHYKVFRPTSNVFLQFVLDSRYQCYLLSVNVTNNFVH